MFFSATLINSHNTLQDVFKTYTSSLCEICSAPVHVTSTQVLTIPVIMEGQASSSLEDTDIATVTETLQEPLATAFVTPSVTGDADGEENAVFITATLVEETGVVTPFINVIQGEGEYTATLTLEKSDSELTVVTRTIDIHQDSDQVLAATKTVDEGLA